MPLILQLEGGVGYSHRKAQGCNVVHIFSLVFPLFKLGFVIGYDDGEEVRHHFLHTPVIPVFFISNMQPL